MAKKRSKKIKKPVEVGPPTFESELCQLLNENFVDCDEKSPIVSRLKEFLKGQWPQIATDEDAALRIRQKLHSGHSFDKGARCPCCEQLVKQYKRRINAQMCYFLIRLHRLTKYTQTGQRYFSTQQLELPYQLGGDWARLRHWGLIEQMPNHEDRKRTSGHWGITDKGKEFVNLQIKVPEKILIHNNHFMGFDGDEIDMQEALDVKFNYKQLMEAYK